MTKLIHYKEYEEESRILLKNESIFFAEKRFSLKFIKQEFENITQFSIAYAAYDIKM